MSGKGLQPSARLARIHCCRQTQSSHPYVVHDGHDGLGPCLAAWESPCDSPQSINKSMLPQMYAVQVLFP